MKNPLKTLEPNTTGRDFVIGDLHGSYSAFKHLLQNINFDPTVDRIISVGDMVDRGPDSLSCLSLIREPWFHAVLANHEQMMCNKFTGGFMGAYWFQNGGQWGMEAYNDYNHIYNLHTEGRIATDKSMELIDLLPLVEELPYLITIKMQDGKKFHVLHAELPSGTTITDKKLADPAEVYSLATIQRGDGDAFLWSRNLFGSFYAANLADRKKIIRTINYNPPSIFNKNLSHIISGHTILQRPMTIVGQTNIDTGAYSSYWAPIEPYSSHGAAPKAWAALTCIQLDTWKFYQATADTFKEVDPFVVDATDLTSDSDN